MTKLAYNRHLEKYAISNLGAILDTDTDLDALMSRHEMLDTDSDVLDTLDFGIDGLELKEISSEEILENYIQKQVSRIPQHGDDCLWRIASACDLFEDLSQDGTLTADQKSTLETFVERIRADKGVEWHHF